MLVLLRHAEDPVPLIVQRYWDGEILAHPRGEGGFGYDPLFWVPDQKMSAAELSASEKNRLSHRGRALHAWWMPCPIRRGHHDRPSSAPGALCARAWCVRKCPYCDFNSHGVGRGADLPEEEYLAALIDDLDADLSLAAGREIVSVFIGGGTPSLMAPAFYRRLLEALAARLPLASDIEITLEANPGTLERGRFAGYREAGINRLSLGVQSFQDDQLAALGRIHGGADAEAAIEEARDAGFDNLNIDLMHGLPGQTVELALSDLDRALTFSPEHLSWYQLTLEPNTEFHSRPPTLPEEEVLWDIQDIGHERLEAAGLGRYEISAYARPGRRARHNLNYWRFGDYLGIGAGAHGKLSTWTDNGWQSSDAGRRVSRRRI